VSLTGQGEHRFRYTVERPKEANPQIIRQLIMANISVVAIQELPRSLETIYLKAMAQVAEGVL
jgi:hypothetical protein